MEKMTFATSASDLLSPEQLASLSGLEFIAGICEGRFPAPPICRTLNYWMDEVEEGRVVFRGRPNFDAMNPIGTIHGGWFGTLLDSCMACAVQTTLPRGTGYTTLEYKINILRPLFSDSEDVLAIGTCAHSGRKTGVAEGQMIGVESQKTYAVASTTCLIFEL